MQAFAALVHGDDLNTSHGKETTAGSAEAGHCKATASHHATTNAICTAATTTQATETSRVPLHLHARRQSTAQYSIRRVSVSPPKILEVTVSEDDALKSILCFDAQYSLTMCTYARQATGMPRNQGLESVITLPCVTVATRSRNIQRNCSGCVNSLTCATTVVLKEQRPRLGFLPWYPYPNRHTITVSFPFCYVIRWSSRRCSSPYAAGNVQSSDTTPRSAAQPYTTSHTAVIQNYIALHCITALVPLPGTRAAASLPAPPSPPSASAPTLALGQSGRSAQRRVHR